MHLKKLFLTVAAAAFVSAISLADNTKYALCVGINEYSYDDLESLKGCVNDAKFFRANLIELGGWSGDNTTLLLDSAATKDAIRAAIAAVADKAVAGDTFVYQHSSHGGSSEDGDGNYTTDVCLYAHDTYYWDSELAEDLESFQPGVKVVVIVDACHSSGLFKGARRRGAKAVAETRPFDLAQRVTAIMDASRTRRLARREKGAATKLASSEIGWVTAAEYYEESIDGGFYDTDKWLTDPKAEGYATGGFFLGSFTWSWWSGSADCGEDGDNDGWFDAYEGWSIAKAFCMKLDNSWGKDVCPFTPQFLNEGVLRSVELGVSGTPLDIAVIFPPPENDNFADATVIEGKSGSAYGTNLFATRENGEPEHIKENKIGSVWWSWTAPADGIVAFDTKGSDFDTVMAVYTNSTFATLGLVVANDDEDRSAGINTSRCVFDTVAGTTYHVAVAGYSKMGNIVLNWDAQLMASWSPEDGTIRLKTGDTQAFSVKASSPDGDPILYSWSWHVHDEKNGGWFDEPIECNASEFTWTPESEDIGTHYLHVHFSDGKRTSSCTWTIDVSKPETYTVAFDRNGGVGTMDDMTATNGVATTLTANAFTRDGYDFAGWALTANGEVAYANGATVEDDLAAAAETATLYAVWAPITYTATFDANGGQGGKEVALAYGAALSASAPAVTRDGYAFAGWKPAVPDTMPIGGGTYEAQWTPIAYKATFNANGGQGGKVVTVAYGAALSAPKVTRAGYTFAGWKPAVPATMPAANVTYNAQWTPTTYKVVFNANGGRLPKGKKMDAQKLTYGKSANLTKNAFTNKGYNFYGWAISVNDAKKGIVAYKDGQKVSNLRKDGKTTTLYAIWAKPTYKIAFYGTLKGVKGKMTAQKLAYGKSAKLNANKFTLKGYKFAGWATSAANAKKGKATYKNKQAVQNLVNNGATVKLYAVWKK